MSIIPTIPKKYFPAVTTICLVLIYFGIHTYLSSEDWFIISVSIFLLVFAIIFLIYIMINWERNRKEILVEVIDSKY